MCFHCTIIKFSFAKESYVFFHLLVLEPPAVRKCILVDRFKDKPTHCFSRKTRTKVLEV